MMVDGMVLAVLKGLEAIDYNFLCRGMVSHHPGMEQKAVPAQSGNVTVDGFGGYFDIAGDLAVGHPAIDLHKDLGVQAGSLLPIRSCKCL
jgi:hypothetical protein